MILTLPELNDINKVKYVKTKYYQSDKEGKLKEPRYSIQNSEIFINEKHLPISLQNKSIQQ